MFVTFVNLKYSLAEIDNTWFWTFPSSNR